MIEPSCHLRTGVIHVLKHSPLFTIKLIFRHYDYSYYIQNQIRYRAKKPVAHESSRLSAIG